METDENVELTSTVSDHVGPLRALLTESIAAVEAREASALDALLREHDGRCVIFGAGTLGRKAIGLFRKIGIEPLAIVDSNPDRWGSDVAGLTVLSPAEAAARFGADSVFFVTIWNDFHWFRDTRARLTALGCTAVSSYAPIFWRFGDRFMELRLLNEPPHRLYQQLDDVFAAEGLWADEESLATYHANIVWRALGDPSHLPFPAPQNTYFPVDIFKLITEEAIVDCGAFDGDTIRLLVSMVGNSFAAVHAVEADSVSGAKLKAYQSSLPAPLAAKIHHLECAVGATRCTLQFAMTGDATSKVENAGVDVPCVPIDELFADQPVTLIKMDIEGAEYDALRGARKVIERDRPVLAICVYHTQSDVWRIPLLVQSMGPGYSFFLRAYDGDGFQSVMYAVPEGRMLSAAERAAVLRLTKPISA